MRYRIWYSSPNNSTAITSRSFGFSFLHINTRDKLIRLIKWPPDTTLFCPKRAKLPLISLHRLLFTSFSVVLRELNINLAKCSQKPHPSLCQTFIKHLHQRFVDMNEPIKSARRPWCVDSHNFQISRDIAIRGNRWHEMTRIFKARNTRAHQCIAMETVTLSQVFNGHN